MNFTYGGGFNIHNIHILRSNSFQRSVDDFSAILEEAILAHSFGSLDAKTCGDKVLCEIFLPKQSLETPPPVSNSLRHLVQKKFR